MTQADLGFTIGAWQSRISELEKGKLDASVSQLMFFAECFHIHA